MENEKKSETLEHIKQKLEAQDLDESIQRVQTLLKDQEEPASHSLGILLALMMTAEIRDGIAPGTNTAPLVAQWTEKYHSSKVEEVVSYARDFLTNPSKIAETLGNRLFGETSPNDAESQ